MKHNLNVPIIIITTNSASYRESRFERASTRRQCRGHSLRLRRRYVLMSPAIRVTVSDVHGRVVELIRRAEDIIRDVKADAISELDAPEGLRHVMFHDVSAGVGCLHDYSISNFSLGLFLESRRNNNLPHTGCFPFRASACQTVGASRTSQCVRCSSALSLAAAAVPAPTPAAHSPPPNGRPATNVKASLRSHQSASCCCRLSPCQGDSQPGSLH